MVPRASHVVSVHLPTGAIAYAVLTMVSVQVRILGVLQKTLCGKDRHLTRRCIHASCGLLEATNQPLKTPDFAKEFKGMKAEFPCLAR